MASIIFPPSERLGIRHMVQERFLTIRDSDAWNRLLPPGKSVFGSIGYARICAAFRKCTPRLYAAELNHAAICYPLLLRPLSELSFAGGTDGIWDATTPEFTGPMAFGVEPVLAENFSSSRDKAFRKEGIIAEFAHLQPWKEAATRLFGVNECNREIVWVDSKTSPGELWRTHLAYSCQKNIRTAQRNGVKVFEGTTDEHIREFYRIYLSTMLRNNASPSYLYSLEYFQAFREEMPNHCRFAIAEYGGRIVAGTLYLHDDSDVYSYLGGADADFQHVRPTNMIVWETILWAHSAGKERLVLGGGYKANDGIFRFKSTFSRLRKSFHVYKKIHQERDYSLLEQRCREYYALNGKTIQYFPSYRYAPYA
jgi:hypothetical protein